MLLKIYAQEYNPGNQIFIAHHILTITLKNRRRAVLLLEIVGESHTGISTPVN